MQIDYTLHRLDAGPRYPDIELFCKPKTAITNSELMDLIATTLEDLNPDWWFTPFQDFEPFKHWTPDNDS